MVDRCQYLRESVIKSKDTLSDVSLLRDHVLSDVEENKKCAPVAMILYSLRDLLN